MSYNLEECKALIQIYKLSTYLLLLDFIHLRSHKMYIHLQLHNLKNTKPPTNIIMYMFFVDTLYTYGCNTKYIPPTHIVAMSAVKNAKSSFNNNNYSYSSNFQIYLQSSYSNYLHIE